MTALACFNQYPFSHVAKYNKQLPKAILETFWSSCAYRRTCGSSSYKATTEFSADNAVGWNDVHFACLHELGSASRGKYVPEWRRFLSAGTNGDAPREPEATRQPAWTLSFWTRSPSMRPWLQGASLSALFITFVLAWPNREIHNTLVGPCRRSGLRDCTSICAFFTPPTILPKLKRYSNFNHRLSWRR